MSQISRSASVESRSQLQTATGGYAMLALDQRESLRGMFAQSAGGGFVDDDTLRDFKATALRLLSPHASAVLLDRPLALSTGRPDGLAPGCALIAAVDVLHQLPGHDITHVTFDDVIGPDFVKEVGASAIKVLVLWHRDFGLEERAELVEQTIDLARRAGVVSLVEGIVRPSEGTHWRSSEERHAAILDCARELTAFAPDIYKSEVPGYINGDLTRIAEQSRQMSEIVGGEWVILSNGVERDAFPAALTEARKGGANGFLAGRAVWADTVREADVGAALETRSVARLQHLTDIVATGA